MFLLAESGFTKEMLFVVLIVAASLVVLILLIKSIKRERVNYSETRIQDKSGSTDINKFIQKRIETATKKTAFSVLRIDIYDAETLQNNIGSIQLENVISEMLSRLGFLMTEGTKCFVNGYTIIYYFKDVCTISQLNFMAKAILAETQKPYTLVGSLKVDIDVNICALSYPDCGKTYDELEHSLELAMIVAKRAGINTFKLYDKQLSNAQTEEYKYYKEIKDAITNREFTLYYQPIFDINKMAIIGAESLLRWNHKTMGILPPGKFLNIMEQSGDIYWVGLWAFEQLVKSSQQLKMKFPDGDIILSMNLSPKQLLNSELVNELKRILLKHRAEASDFCMEIVEFAMFDKIEAVQENITRLKQLGFKVAIDNYGLEFSTITRLDTLPIDTIKLDRSFLSKTENSFTKNIIDMLMGNPDKNFTLIAEGIEDEASVNKVKSFNINLGQGYYFSKPCSYIDLVRAIEETLTEKDISADEPPHL